MEFFSGIADALAEARSNGERGVVNDVTPASRGNGVLPWSA